MTTSPLVRQCVNLLLHSKNSSNPLPPANAAQLHAVLLTSGYLHYRSLGLLFLSYCACGRPFHAHNLLSQMSHPPSVSFSNTLLRSYTGLGFHREALVLYSQMRAFDHLTFPFAAKACGGLRLCRHGRAVHCRAVAAGFGGDTYAQNSLVSMYMSCGDVVAAEAVFGAMQNRTVVSWNTIITGCVKNGRAERALEVFEKMVGGGVGIDRATVVSVLPACAQAMDLSTGRTVHRLVEESGLGAYVAVKNALIDMYGKCGSLEDARRVFDDCKYNKDVVSWTAMIGACVLNDRAGEALALGCEMLMTSEAWPNGVTMAYLLSACASLPSGKHAKCTHALCIRLGLVSDIVVETALVDSYAKCDHTKMIEMMVEKGSRRTETWNAAISGYTHREQEEKAIQLFKRMFAESVRPDSATMASVLPAYAKSAGLVQAKNIHCCLLTLGFLGSTEIVTGLIDVHAKAGDLEVAWALFQWLPEKDVVAWTTVIAGYGMHGHARTAILLYDRMVELGVKPNAVTIASLMYSCSHAGMIDEGLRLFDDMRNVHGLMPNAEHYWCLVDMLGRAGRIEEAYRLIEDMPFEPSTSVWGALLGACVLHENVEFGEIAAKHLLELEPENTGNYVLLGKVYATADRWGDVQDLRRMMAERGLCKAPGSSVVDARSESCQTSMQ
ncbi:pentatricopeptide repeat-containing protein At5g39350-like [Phragmites australis]|uniref:pentatricopeptide repeat-containing protein At5g39350-like n=1 Tax=Phragmites australis TaxID=29695 RepID=UPI002D7739A2|nr:pentatricopeptide repeat-containing protein At5g39350-like [Phragmites australis]